MPQGPAARILDPVAHPLPPVLTGGPPAFTVLIGFQPAWKGVPLAIGAGLQVAQQASEAVVKTAEAAAVAAAPTPGGPVARAAAETAKGIAVAAMSSAISAAAAGGASIHMCTTPWPAVPHGPGVVIDGSPTVMIENMPACRMGDTIVEAIGPPNKITMGCMTVIIGNTGSGSTVNVSPLAGAMRNASQSGAALVCKDDCEACKQA
jgi:uncharacterized Zn-binding protein involved in type VI secretion